MMLTYRLKCLTQTNSCSIVLSSVSKVDHWQEVLRIKEATKFQKVRNRLFVRRPINFQFELRFMDMILLLELFRSDVNRRHNRSVFYKVLTQLRKHHD